MSLALTDLKEFENEKGDTVPFGKIEVFWGLTILDKQGMDAFKKFLSVFKDRRVSDFGKEKQYREIVKFLAYLNRVEIGAFVTCLNNTIYDVKRKCLSYNKCMGSLKNTDAGNGSGSISKLWKS